MLFIEQMVRGEFRHVFIGGGVEEGEELREAVLRELMEEANIAGEIIFGPVELPGKNEYVFIVGIPEDARPVLGSDPELPSYKQDITSFVWFDIEADSNKFNLFDAEYFNAVIREGEIQSITDGWLSVLRDLTKRISEARI